MDILKQGIELVLLQGRKSKKKKNWTNWLNQYSLLLVDNLDTKHRLLQYVPVTICAKHFAFICSWNPLIPAWEKDYDIV